MREPEPPGGLGVARRAARGTPRHCGCGPTPDHRRQATPDRTSRQGELPPGLIATTPTMLDNRRVRRKKEKKRRPDWGIPKGDRAVGDARGLAPQPPHHGRRHALRVSGRANQHRPTRRASCGGPDGDGTRARLPRHRRRGEPGSPSGALGWAWTAQVSPSPLEPNLPRRTPRAKSQAHSASPHGLLIEPSGLTPHCWSQPSQASQAWTGVTTNQSGCELQGCLAHVPRVPSHPVPVAARTHSSPCEQPDGSVAPLRTAVSGPEEDSDHDCASSFDPARRRRG